MVKTRNFSNPRMVGNPVQAARVYNSRGVDELVFLDIFASQQNRKINLKLVKDVIKECYMPVAIGGGINSIEDINDLLKIGADKVVIKTKALTDLEFIKKAVQFFGSQCITIAVDVINKENIYKIYNNIGLDLLLDDFIKNMEACDVGEYVLTSVDQDGMMSGFDITLIKSFENKTKKPLIAAGGGGKPEHYTELFTKTNIEAVGSASIFHFTQFTPLDIKQELLKYNIPVRI
ncbi:MAG: imidazole glycerol phosphate synthase subunit HisF [Bacteroidia bacterium]